MYLAQTEVEDICRPHNPYPGTKHEVYWMTRFGDIAIRNSQK